MPAATLGRRVRNDLVVDFAGALAGLGFGATLALGLTAESRGALAAPGGISIAVGRLAGLAGTYLLLLMVLLMARIPAVERAVGQDRLARWHARIGPWPIVLLGAHVVFITLGYAQSSTTGVIRQFWLFIDSYPDVLAAVVGFALLVMVAVLSVRAARRRLRYETWWAIHLYVYIALALSFAHQLATGASFLGHPLARVIWSSAWASTAGIVLVCRLGIPLWRTVRHGLAVVAVHEEAPGVVSLVCSGRRLDKLSVKGGQFFQWRFLARGMWWQAHPYSISALPMPPYIRVTVRTDGDHGRRLESIPIGTRVAIEGPYGRFTADSRRTDRVLLVGAGVGVTPLRAILEDLPSGVDVAVIVRCSSRDELVLHRELEELVSSRSGVLHAVVGPRDKVRLDERAVRRLVPDIARRDIFICGPSGFADGFVGTAHKLGAPKERIHLEQFAL